VCALTSPENMQPQRAGISWIRRVFTVVLTIDVSSAIDLCSYAVQTIQGWPRAPMQTFRIDGQECGCVYLSPHLSQKSQQRRERQQLQWQRSRSEEEHSEW